MKTLDLKHSFKITMESTTIIIENVQHRFINENIHTHSHGELCFEIHYIQNGTGTLFLDGKTYALDSGKLFLAGPYIKHAQTPTPGEALEEFYVYFSIKKLPSSLDTENTEWNLMLSSLINNPSWFGEDKYNTSIIMNELLNTALKKEFGYQTELKSLFLQFLIRLLKNILPDNQIKPAHSSENHNASVHKILEIAFSRYDITLEQLATDLFLSQRQTERIIKKLYGKSFSQKKKEARMLAASDLLLSTDKSILEIAESLSFSSIGHFSNQFKQYYGITPSEYRKDAKSLFKQTGDGN